jgi:N-acetylglucosamine-6-phosphate deacetylase
MSAMRIGASASVVDGRIVAGDVSVVNGVVDGVGLTPAGRRGRLAVPGLVDLQVNGVGDIDFAAADEASWAVAGTVLAAAGTTAYQPTFVTDAPERTLRALDRLPSPAWGAKILGAHLEGPFISPHRLGAHRGDWRLDPDPVLMGRFLATGRVRHVTLAPELEGAAALIEIAGAHGATVACGHSDATAAEADAAFDRGATVVTHLFNAMRVGDYHDPGLALAALARSDVYVTVIADNVHVAPAALLVAWRAARGRMALISDMVPSRMAGSGLMRDGTVLRREDGILAGSASPLLEGVRNLVGVGVPLLDAVLAATQVPAAIAHTEVGSLEPGRPADLLLLDDRLDLHTVLVDGAVVEA